MNNRKIGKCVKKVLRQMKRERKRCAKQYPDWRDDEFNNLDNKFIWGCLPIDAPFYKVPSFNTWDDAYVYFNRADNKYYMEIDTGFYSTVWNEELARMELERLNRIKNGFRDFLKQNDISYRGNLFPFKDPSLSATTLTELYLKLSVMIEGYRAINNL